MLGEKLIIVLRLDEGKEATDALREEIADRNRRLLNFKRVSGYVIWREDFPRTASMKVKRFQLAEQIRQHADRETALKEL